MADKEIGKKAVGATKWSLVTQVASKLILPLTQLVLAHILSPEIFGVIALVTMVTSFADMFSDAGFQKYLIQHEYESGKHFSLSANVAFWTNLLVSLLLWLAIAILQDPIASLVGDGSIGLAIVVACASLPFTAAVSVQTAVYQRSFDFKTLFWSKIGSATLIFLVSVPLAIFGFGYWSMIAGTVLSNLFLAVWLTAKSSWKPSLQYSFTELKKMFSFSAWTLIEAFSIWLTNWVGAFILGSMMSTYYLGLYNTSVSLVSAAVGIVSGAVNPVVFATLSRLQFDRARFDSSFFKMQKWLGFVVVPFALALFVFSELFVGLYLGDAWLEAVNFFGLYSLASAFVVVFGHMASDAYRSLGKPKLSFLAQVGFLLFMVPSLVVGAKLGFETLSWLVPLFRLIGSLTTHFLICGIAMRLSPWKMVVNLRWVYFAAAVDSLFCYAVIAFFELDYLGQFGLLISAIILYLILVLLIRDLRETLLEIAERFGFLGMVKKLLPTRLLKKS